MQRIIKTKAVYSVLAIVLAFSAFFISACDAGDVEKGDPNDKIVLKKYNMFINDEIAGNNSYGIGISAPQEWTQTQHDLRYSDNFDIYDYYHSNASQYGESRTSIFKFHYPVVLLQGNNSDYAYGYLDFGSEELPPSSKLEDYYDLFVSANDIGNPENNKQISMDAWLPYTGKLQGISFEADSGTSRERIVLFKMKAPLPSEDGYSYQDASFGIFRIGCKKEDFASKSTLYDRMEKSIFGYGAEQNDRDHLEEIYKVVYDYPRKTYSALGLSMELPATFSGFTTAAGYANSFSDIFDIHNGIIRPELAGRVKLEIYRDPVSQSGVFSPVTDLYAIHADSVSDLADAPYRLTTIAGNPAVYSIHHTYKELYRVQRHFSDDVSDNCLYAKEAIRDIVYTTIIGEYIYTIGFQIVFDFEQTTQFGTNNLPLGDAVYYMDVYEEAYVFNTIKGISLAV